MKAELKAALAEPIEVREPSIAVSPEELMVRLFMARHAHAARTPLSPTEPITLDTEVTLDAMALIDQRPVPLSVLRGQQILLTQPGVEPLAAALLGRKVGDEVRFIAPLPDTFPLARWREGPVQQVAWVRQAVNLQWPKEDDAQFLRALGLGADLKDTFKVLAQSAAQEHALQSMVLLGEDIALLLATRLKLVADERAIDAVLSAAWAHTDGAALLGLQQSHAVLQASRLSWRHEPQLRSLAQRQHLTREVIGQLAQDNALSVKELGSVVEQVVAPHAVGHSALSGRTASSLLNLANAAAWTEAMRQVTRLPCVRFLA
ncbi:MAG: GreA/GreB family elongation factor [Myxococcaceae bacterium]|nr:GreA/GreB family elongation factor [Myxococcaceae bacterium]